LAAEVANLFTTIIEVLVLAVLLVAVLDPLLPMVVLADTFPVVGLAVKVFPVRNAFLGAILIKRLVTSMRNGVIDIQGNSGQ